MFSVFFSFTVWEVICVMKNNKNVIIHHVSLFTTRAALTYNRKETSRHEIRRLKVWVSPELSDWWFTGFNKAHFYDFNLAAFTSCEVQIWSRETDKSALVCFSLRLYMEFSSALKPACPWSFMFNHLTRFCLWLLLLLTHFNQTSSVWNC